MQHHNFPAHMMQQKGYRSVAINNIHRFCASNCPSTPQPFSPLSCPLLTAGAAAESSRLAAMMILMRPRMPLRGDRHIPPSVTQVFVTVMMQCLRFTSHTSGGVHAPASLPVSVVGR
jgi:hypothetical protein